MFAFLSSHSFDEIIGLSDHQTLAFWVKIYVGVCIPMLLLYAVADNFISEIANPYADYPISALLIGGWGVTALSIAGGIYMGHRYNQRKGTRATDQ